MKPIRKILKNKYFQNKGLISFCLFLVIVSCNQNDTGCNRNINIFNDRVSLVIPCEFKKNDDTTFVAHKNQVRYTNKFRQINVYMSDEPNFINMEIYVENLIIKLKSFNTNSLFINKHTADYGFIEYITPSNRKDGVIIYDGAKFIFKKPLLYYCWYNSISIKDSLNIMEAREILNSFEVMN